MPRRLRLSFAAALVISGVLACENSPFEPKGEGERVPIGRVIQDSVVTGSIKWYSFSAESSELFVVFLEALQGRVFLSVQDSIHPFFNGPVLTADAGGPPLDDNPSATFGTQTRTVYRVGVRVSPPDSLGRYRFRIYQINQAPEHVLASFTFGDTVAGETIEPRVDIDQFIAHGDAGDQIVAVAETPGPVGSGSVALNVVDPTTKTFLGYVFADAGTATSLTTGRMRLPSSGDYQFTASSVSANIYPRYRGPYRFWTYVVNPQPEHGAASIPFDREIANERIDRAGDVDEFTFQATAGGDYNAFVQGSSPTFQVEVALQGGATLAIGSSEPGDTALFAHATNRFHVTNGGTYVLRVTATKPSQVADTGAYRLYLYAIDPRPEHVPSTIAGDDTVIGEDIGFPGDVDEFTFTGAVGDEYDVFLQAQNGLPESSARLEVLDPAGSLLAAVESKGTDTSLIRQPTGRFRLPFTGTYRLRVTGLKPFTVPDYRGGYRLLRYRVDPRPESIPSTLSFGDSLTGEAIDLPGDVDEFVVRVTNSSGGNLAFALDNPPEGVLTVQLVDSATRRLIGTSTTYAAGRAAMGRMRVAAGTYVVRVDGSQPLDRSILRGPYRLWFYRFGFGPEAVSDTFAIGDTVFGEAIEPWGDADQFHFYGVRDQHVNIMVQGLSTPSSGAFQFWVTPPPGFSDHGVVMFAPTSTNALQDRQSGRVDLPATGWYTVEVAGYTGAFSERGPYRFTVQPIDPGPEHVSAALGIGDSVTTEPIDVLGDIDEFTVTGPPGQDVSVVVDGRDGYVGPFVRVWVLDPVTFDTLAEQPAQFHRIAGPFRVPPGGQFKIVVGEPRGLSAICLDPMCSGFRFVGPYGFHIVPVNRAPENNPAAYTVGDTVRGETIDPVGDIDEFTSSGTPGEVLTPFVRLLAQSPLDSAVVLEVIDPSTPGGALLGSNAAFFGATFGSPGSFTVPTGGSFLIRLHVFGEAGYGVGRTAYEFFVKRGP